jgi:hypothetical protein
MSFRVSLFLVICHRGDGRDTSFKGKYTLRLYPCSEVLLFSLSGVPALFAHKVFRPHTPTSESHVTVNNNITMVDVTVGYETCPTRAPVLYDAIILFGLSSCGTAVATKGVCKIKAYAAAGRKR